MDHLAPIITLTSDLGDTGHYPAVLKGILLSMYRPATIVDITHNVPSFDVMQAAYLLKHTYSAYPAGTIHIIAVDPGDNSTATGLVLFYEDQYFIAPDNGVLSLICDGKVSEAIEVQNPSLLRSAYPGSFRAARVFAPVAAFLASGGTLDEVGQPVPMRDLRWGAPSYTGDCLRGKIIHIDKFGNAITNIHKSHFLEMKGERRFEIFIRNVRLQRIVNTYTDVPKADALAIFGESKQLEVAMREASAAQMLGLKVHDMITIEFRDALLPDEATRQSVNRD
ncbi:MAG: SAM-dependent chlorinase/fluorinase [Bacteroidota bacterium]